MVEQPQRVQAADAGDTALLPVEPPEVDALLLERVVQLREGLRWDTVVLPGGAREYAPVRRAYAGGDAYGPDEVRAFGVDRTGREGPAGRAGPDVRASR